MSNYDSYQLKAAYHDRKTDASMFLQKTYKMISYCQPEIASWDEDGIMFIIKDQKVFEKEVIPQFFKHSKFTSFARQLHFYGFHKMKNRATKWDVYRNENFKRHKPELMKKIQRSTKGGHSGNQDHHGKIMALKGKVVSLERDNSDMNRRIATLEQLISHHFPQQPQSYQPQSQSQPQSQDDRRSYSNGSEMNGAVAYVHHNEEQSSSSGTSSYVEGVLSSIEEDSSSKKDHPILATHPREQSFSDDDALPLLSLEVDDLEVDDLDVDDWRSVLKFVLGSEELI